MSFYDKNTSSESSYQEESEDGSIIDDESFRIDHQTIRKECYNYLERAATHLPIIPFFWFSTDDNQNYFREYRQLRSLFEENQYLRKYLRSGKNVSTDLNNNNQNSQRANHHQGNDQANVNTGDIYNNNNSRELIEESDSRDNYQTHSSTDTKILHYKVECCKTEEIDNPKFPEATSHGSSSLYDDFNKEHCENDEQSSGSSILKSSGGTDVNINDYYTSSPVSPAWSYNSMKNEVHFCEKNKILGPVRQESNLLLTQPYFGSDNKGSKIWLDETQEQQDVNYSLSIEKSGLRDNWKVSQDLPNTLLPQSEFFTFRLLYPPSSVPDATTNEFFLASTLKKPSSSDKNWGSHNEDDMPSPPREGSQPWGIVPPNLQQRHEKSSSYLRILTGMRQEKFWYRYWPDWTNSEEDEECTPKHAKYEQETINTEPSFWAMFRDNNDDGVEFEE